MTKSQSPTTTGRTTPRKPRAAKQQPAADVAADVIAAAEQQPAAVVAVDATLAAIDARGAAAVAGIRTAEAEATRSIVASYVTLGNVITERYLHLTPAGDVIASELRKWSDVAPVIGLGAVGSSYQGMSKQSCERAWIASRDLDTDAKLAAWVAAGTAAKLAASEARAEQIRINAAADSSDDEKAAAKLAAINAADAAKHLAYEGTGIRSAVAYATAKRGNRIGTGTPATDNAPAVPALTPHTIRAGSGRGGTGAGGPKIAADVRSAVDAVSRHLEGHADAGAHNVAGVTAAFIAELDQTEAKRLAAVLLLCCSEHVLPTAAEREAAEREEAAAAELAAPQQPAADVAVDAKQQLAAELAALTAKLAALPA